MSTDESERPGHIGTGIGRLVTKDLRPYVYRGRDTEPDPGQIADAVRARLAGMGVRPPEDEGTP